MPYRAALIGLGRIADTIDDEQVGSGWLYPFSHMGSYAEVPEVQVVGAADLYAEQRATFGGRWGIASEHLYEDYHDLLERERPEIVSVCTSAAPRARIVLEIARMVRERAARACGPSGRRSPWPSPWPRRTRWWTPAGGRGSSWSPTPCGPRTSTTAGRGP